MESSLPADSSLGALISKIGVTLICSAIVVVACLNSTALQTGAEPGVVMKLPEKVGAFTGTSTEVSDAEKRILPGDTEIIRKVYEDGSGRQIICSIVLSGGEKRSIHRPEICLPAQGWTIGARSTLPVPLDDHHTMNVTKLNLTRPVEASPNVFVPVRSQFLYWFIGKDKTTPSNLERILLTSWDRVFHKVNHRWAYVQASAVVQNSFKSSGFDEAQTTEMLKTFLREAVPTFQKSEMPRS